MNLKEILERPICPNKALAGMKLRSYQNKIGVMTYDEAIMLAREAHDMFKTLPSHDPAWEFMYQQTYVMYQYAAHTSLLGDQARQEHQIKVKALVSYKDDVVEHEFLIDTYLIFAASKTELVKVVRGEVISALHGAHITPQEYPEVVLSS